MRLPDNARHAHHGQLTYAYRSSICTVPSWPCLAACTDEDRVATTAMSWSAQTQEHAELLRKDQH